MNNYQEIKDEELMGWKKYSDIASGEEMISLIKQGKITDANTAYRELMTIIGEWPGTSVAAEAQIIIDTRYADQKYIHD